MKIFGAEAWSGFIDVEHFVGSILDVVLEGWPRIVAPNPDELEDPVTNRLVAQIQRSESFRKLPLRVYPRAIELNEDGTVSGIPAIRFETNAPQHIGEFFVFECKRLRFKSGERCKSGNSEYIDGKTQGMTAFVAGKYATPYGHGGMLGYVLCDCANPVPTLERAIKQSTVLALEAGDGLRPSSLRSHVDIRETFHHPQVGSDFRLHHIFLDSKRCRG